MQGINTKKMLIFVIVLFSISLLVGCSGMEKRPSYRGGYLYYPAVLVDADRALDEARAAGKDRECPAEFNEAKARVDRAYEEYMSCKTPGPIPINIVCPPPPPPPPPPAPEPAPIPPPPPPVAEPVKIILEDIHFDFDKATLTKVALDILDSNIRTLKENPGVSVQIEGHTCAHGSEDYNMALGERRANAVKEYLANQGIASDRMTTISYGETRLLMPEIPTPKNKESVEAKANRRVHFEVIVK